MKALFIHLDESEEEIFIGSSNELPDIYKLIPVHDEIGVFNEPLMIKYYRRLDIFKKGLRVFHQLPHIPSEPFQQD